MSYHIDTFLDKLELIRIIYSHKLHTYALNKISVRTVVFFILGILVTMWIIKVHINIAPRESSYM